MCVRLSLCWALTSLAHAAPMYAQRAPSGDRAETPRLLWRSANSFTSVSAVRVYGDGSMLVADPGARELVWLGRDGVTRKLGRIGSGPAEYQAPQSVHWAPSGQTVMIDSRLQRFLVMDSLGRALHTAPFPGSSTGLSGRVVTDASGRMLYQGMPTDPTLPNVTLMRFDFATGRQDTVSQMLGTRFTDVPVVSRDNTKREMRRSFLVVPFAPKDGFAPASQNEVLILRAQTKRLEWIDSRGKLLASRPLPPPVEIPVPKESLERVRPEGLRQLVPPMQLAVDVDFLVGSASGDVWLPRVPPVGAKSTEWVVVRRGAPDRMVRLPTRARLLAVVGSKIVLAESDADDLESIAVYQFTR